MLVFLQDAGKQSTPYPLFLERRLHQDVLHIANCRIVRNRPHQTNQLTVSRPGANDKRRTSDCAKKQSRILRISRPTHRFVKRQHLSIVKISGRSYGVARHRTSVAYSPPHLIQRTKLAFPWMTDTRWRLIENPLSRTDKRFLLKTAERLRRIAGWIKQGMSCAPMMVLISATSSCPGVSRPS